MVRGAFLVENFYSLRLGIPKIGVQNHHPTGGGGGGKY